MLALYVAMPASRSTRPGTTTPAPTTGTSGRCASRVWPDLGDRVARAVPLWRGQLLGGHHGPRAIDQLRLDGGAADVDGECEVVVVHCARMARPETEPNAR